MANNYSPLQRQLLNRLAVEFHSRRDRQAAINGFVVNEDKDYSFTDVQKILKFNSYTLEALIKEGFVASENSKINGYEVFRLNKKRQLSSALTKDTARKILNTQTPCIDDLVKQGVVANGSKSGEIEVKSFNHLLNYIFPKYGTSQYGLIKSLLRTNPVENSRKLEATYVSPRDVPFKHIYHYQIIPDNEVSHPDAMYIRGKEISQKPLMKRELTDGIELHSTDIDRLFLARAYLKWSQIENYRGVYDQEVVRTKLVRAHTPPILYKEKEVYPPGTQAMVALQTAEIEKVATVAHQFISVHGPFISIENWKKMSHDEIAPMEFEVKYPKIGFLSKVGLRHYNIFQLVQANFDFLTK